MAQQVSAARAAAFSNISAATTQAASSSSLISSLTSNTQLVGSVWILSSAIFTTFSATSFLKYTGPPSGDGGNLKKHDDVKDSKSTSVRRIEKKSPVSRPVLLTLYRFSGSLLLGLLVNTPILRVMDRVRQTYESLHHFVAPATFLFVANYCNSIALDRIGISLTYTSKCGIPLITVLMTLFLDGPSALPSVPALLSLVPIAAGIAAASWNSPTFEGIGFLAAIISCTAQAALNISSKKVMTTTKITGPDAQRAMVAVALAITMAMSAVNHIRHISKQEPALEGERAKIISMEKSSEFQGQPPVWLSAAAILSYHIEYVLSFMFVKMVQPITYGTCDAIRRLAIIVSGHRMFGGEPFTRLNLFGIGLALVGALAYAISSM